MGECLRASAEDGDTIWKSVGALMRADAWVLIGAMSMAPTFIRVCASIATYRSHLAPLRTSEMMLVSMRYFTAPRPARGRAHG